LRIVGQERSRNRRGDEGLGVIEVEVKVNVVAEWCGVRDSTGKPPKAPRHSPRRSWNAHTV